MISVEFSCIRVFLHLVHTQKGKLLKKDSGNSLHYFFQQINVDFMYFWQYFDLV